jgi:hypothetical protein
MTVFCIIVVVVTSPKKKKKKTTIKQNGDREVASGTSSKKAVSRPLLQVPTKLGNPGSPASGHDSDAEGPPPGTSKRRYKTPSRAVGGSYLHHIGAILLHPILQRAITVGVDPRTVDLSALREIVGKTFKDEDLQRLSFLLKQEFPHPTVSLPAIMGDIQPLVRVNLKSIQMEVMKSKYKNEIPKLPRSAFQYYLTKKIGKVKEKHPDINGWEFRTVFTEKWTKMDPEEKAKYEEKYQRAKEHHEEEVKQFCKDHPDIVSLPSPIKSKGKVAGGGGPKTSRLTKKDKLLMSMTEEERKQYELNEQAPKPPLTSYVLFCKAKRDRLRQKYPTLTSSQIAQKLGEKWNALDDEDKGKYKKMYQEQMEAYHKNIVEYYDSHPEAVPPQKVAKLLEKLRKPKVTKPKIIDSDLESDSDSDSDSEEDHSPSLKPPAASSEQIREVSTSSTGTDSDDDDSGSSSGSEESDGGDSSDED